MHNYNPPNKYRKETRLGNWSEEWDLQQTKRKEYLRKKDRGISTINQKQRVLTQSLQSASLTYSRDGLRKFGDHVMLFNGKVQGFLVTDVFQRLLNTQESYNVSAIKRIHACSRSVFVIDRLDYNDGYKDNIVHYGQRLRVKINPLLFQKPIYLYSEPSSVSRYSKVSRLQEVILMLKDNFNTVWVLQHPDPNLRLESKGSPIGVDDSVLLKHQMTNQWLAAVEKTYENTFGQEYEVLAHNFLVNNKSQSLTQQKKGYTTIDIPSRSQTTENLWMLIGASSPDQQFDEFAIKNAVITEQAMRKKLKYLLTERGVYGIRFLHKMFRCLDKEGTGALDEQDFRWGIQSGKIFITEEELSYLIEHYKTKKGISYADFLGELRGTLNKTREQSIIDAYNRARKVIGNAVTLQELGRIYDAKRHPQVLTQKKTDKEAFNEFVWSWDHVKPSHVIQLPEFAAYFEDLSAMIPKDQHFEYLLLNVIHL